MDREFQGAVEITVHPFAKTFFLVDVSCKTKRKITFVIVTILVTCKEMITQWQGRFKYYPFQEFRVYRIAVCFPVPGYIGYARTQLFQIVIRGAYGAGGSGKFSPIIDSPYKNTPKLKVLK